jgi:hypothetical protein
MARGDEIDLAVPPVTQEGLSLSFQWMPDELAE